MWKTVNAGFFWFRLPIGSAGPLNDVWSSFRYMDASHHFSYIRTAKVFVNQRVPEVMIIAMRLDIFKVRRQFTL